MRALLIAFFGMVCLSSCEGLVENDCVCTTKSGEKIEEYDVEGSCSSLSDENATCEVK